MALFGSDWIQDDSSYDTPIGGFSRDEAYEQTAWDQPIGAPVHNISKSDRLSEYESTIKHFGCF